MLEADLELENSIIPKGSKLLVIPMTSKVSQPCSRGLIDLAAGTGS
uniref:Uncharacterized protein n=1 Tax=Rhizophora mucronata TaxID=61149 RepID=A0A2P2NIM3_RHIMU